MWELDCEESWAPKNGCFELWCGGRLLRVPWTARRSNQSILKEISPGCSLEGLMLKLKLQYFGHLVQRADSLEKTLMLGGEGDNRGWDGWMASPTQWAWVWVNSGSWWCTGRPGVLQSMGSQSRTWLSDWTELNWSILNSKYYLRQGFLGTEVTYYKHLEFQSTANNFITYTKWQIWCWYPHLPLPSPEAWERVTDPTIKCTFLLNESHFNQVFGKYLLATYYIRN